MSSFLSSQPVRKATGRSALLLSDLHNNALALEPVGEMADEQPVFFVGDFAHQGNDVETELLAEDVSNLGREVVAVSGNHDSSGLMSRLALEGVVVLDKKGYFQGKKFFPGFWKTLGMDVAGYPDPLEWEGRWPEDPQRVFSFEEMDEDRYEKELQRLQKWWSSLGRKPDILLLHNNFLAADLATWLSNREYPRPLTILTGHSHQPEITRFPSITIVNAGTAGAGALFGVGSERSEIAELRFPNSGRGLDMIDLISIDPINGSARAERSNPNSLCTLPCAFRPLEAETIRMGP